MKSARIAEANRATTQAVAVPDRDSRLAAAGLDQLKARIRTGDVGSLSVIVGLVVIWVTFQMLNDQFLSSGNLYNLTRQISYGAIVSISIVLMLIIREMDLSVGSTAGLGAAVLASLAEKHSVNPVLAIAVVVVMGVFLGLVLGVISTRFNVPSFIVTLGGLLLFFGLQLKVLGENGSIRLPFGEFLAEIQNRTLPEPFGYVIAVLGVAGFGIAMMFERRRYIRAGVAGPSTTGVIIKSALALFVAIVCVFILNEAQGVPISFMILLGLIIAVWLLTTRTRYGQHLFAVGGNPEAAYRAGINVTAIRLSVFALSGAFAAFGGVMLASYVGAASSNTGRETLLLYAIAAAVIGGTSLFGGYGSAWSALIGWLVIGSIYNGMFLLNLDSSDEFTIIGAVLIAAVVIDSVTRRGKAHGEQQ